MMPSISFSYQTLFNHIFSAEQIICPQTAAVEILYFHWFFVSCMGRNTWPRERSHRFLPRIQKRSQMSQTSVSTCTCVGSVCVAEPNAAHILTSNHCHLWSVSWIKLRLLPKTRILCLKWVSSKTLTPRILPDVGHPFTVAEWSSKIPGYICNTLSLNVHWNISSVKTTALRTGCKKQLD